MTLLLGVLLASAAGSIHCAAMCGAFVCVYSRGRPRDIAGILPHAAYNGGRLFSYLLLGALAGAAGGRVNVLGTFAGIGRAAAILAGALMALWALNEIALAVGVRLALPGAGAARWAKAAIGRALLVTRDAPQTSRAAALGLLTTLLPCGWLYAFVLTAAGTGSAGSGALVMLVFWAGTVPMMLGVGFGARRALAIFGKRLPIASAVLVLALGLLSMAGRLGMPAMEAVELPRDGVTHAGH
jgi:hypothetical protein